MSYALVFTFLASCCAGAKKPIGSETYDIVLSCPVAPGCFSGLTRTALYAPERDDAQCHRMSVHLPPTNPSIGRNVALYAIFGLSPIQYPRYR